MNQIDGIETKKRILLKKKKNLELHVPNYSILSSDFKLKISLKRVISPFLLI